MSADKQTVFEQIVHELQSAALNRTDNGSIYIFMKNRDKYNLLIFDATRGVQKANYSFNENNGVHYLIIDSIAYEILMPEAISDVDAFTLTIKSTDGTLIHFENYI